MLMLLMRRGAAGALLLQIDRKALPPPDESAEVVQDLPRTQLERDLAALFAGILGTAIGIHDHFFDNGGDSLAAVRHIPHAVPQLGPSDLSFLRAYSFLRR